MSDNLPRDEITDAIYRFYSLVDAGKADQTIDLFAPDAAWTFGPGTPKPGTIRGQEIKTAMDARSKAVNLLTRHLVTNLILTRATNEEVHAHYFLLLFRSESGDRRPIPHTVADLSERWTLIDGRWKLQSRETMPVFYG